jgi:hypothetical protein
MKTQQLKTKNPTATAETSEAKRTQKTSYAHGKERNAKKKKNNTSRAVQ